MIGISILKFIFNKTCLNGYSTYFILRQIDAKNSKNSKLAAKYKIWFDNLSRFKINLCFDHLKKFMLKHLTGVLLA